MKRRIVTIIMTLCLLLPVVPCECLAQDGEGAQNATVYMTQSVSLPSVSQNDPAMDMMYYFSGPGRGSTVIAPQLGAIPLNGTMQAIYDKLVPHLKSIADGTTAMTTVTLTDFSLVFTKQELGVGALLAETAPGKYTLTTAATDAVKTKLDGLLDLNALFAHLLAELPYELYWLDKIADQPMAVGYQIGAQEQGAAGSVTVGGFTFEFAVAKEYVRLHESEVGGYTYNVSQNTGNPCEVDVKMVQRARYAAAAAAQVVTANAGKSVFDTLTAYKDYICSEVTYDSSAADSSSATPYGDPWQLISVFDGDNATNVVCEGYSKAFKYLCDLTWTESNPAVKCYLATGNMSGGTGAGDHMWNIVTIGEKNYLVDVTNCDTGTVGEGDGLFLRGASGSAETTYTVTVDENNSINYTYDENTRAIYNTELEISATDFDPAVPLVRPQGDLVGENYTLDVSDMARLFEHLSGEKPLKSEDLAYADVNGDTLVNILDYQALYQLIVLGA